MASRGRGRGRGAKRTFNRDQLNALGVVGNEALTQLSNPPPLYIPLHRSTAPLESSEDLEYAIVLKQAFVNYMQLSYSYMKLPEKSSDAIQEKLELPAKGVIYDWKLFPSELRPKLKAVKKVKDEKKKIDINEKLTKLDEIESKTFSTDAVKTEPNADDDEDDENNGEEQMDEDLDDGTDYGNNYFDNGETFFNDEDDNLDDDPVY